MASNRKGRINKELQRELSALIRTLKDPRVQQSMVSVTKVEATGDLRYAKVRMTYKVSSIGTVAGCFVKDGKITRDAQVRVLRDNIVIYEGVLGSLQRFKDSVKEVAANYECGMTIDKYNDIKEGDIFECFVMEQIKV